MKQECKDKIVSCSQVKETVLIFKGKGNYNSQSALRPPASSRIDSLKVTSQSRILSDQSPMTLSFDRSKAKHPPVSRTSANCNNLLGPISTIPEKSNSNHFLTFCVILLTEVAASSLGRVKSNYTICPSYTQSSAHQFGRSLL